MAQEGLVYSLISVCLSLIYKKLFFFFLKKFSRQGPIKSSMMSVRRGPIKGSSQGESGPEGSREVTAAGPGGISQCSPGVQLFFLGLFQI